MLRVTSLLGLGALGFVLASGLPMAAVLLSVEGALTLGEGGVRGWLVVLTAVLGAVLFAAGFALARRDAGLPAVTAGLVAALGVMLGVLGLLGVSGAPEALLRLLFAAGVVSGGSVTLGVLRAQRRAGEAAG